MNRFTQYSTLILGLLLGNMAFAYPTATIVAGNATGVMYLFSRLFAAMSICIAIGFSVSAVSKYKHHRENPSQMPMSTVVTMMVSAAVLFLFTFFIYYANHGVFGPNGGQLNQFSYMFPGLMH